MLRLNAAVPLQGAAVDTQACGEEHTCWPSAYAAQPSCCLLRCLQGQYPVVRDDAAQMCALQMQAEYGPTLAEDSATFVQALEKYMVKQVQRAADGGGRQRPVFGVPVFGSAEGSLRPKCPACWLQVAAVQAVLSECGLPTRSPRCPGFAQILTSRPRQEWLNDVAARYRALSQFSKDDARIQYLRIIRSLPYGNSIFFTVKVRAWLVPHGRLAWCARRFGAEGAVAAVRRSHHFFLPVSVQGGCPAVVSRPCQACCPLTPQLSMPPLPLLHPCSASRTPSACSPPS